MEGDFVERVGEVLAQWSLTGERNMLHGLHLGAFLFLRLLIAPWIWQPPQAGSFREVIADFCRDARWFPIFKRPTFGLVILESWEE
jgi:hypothetical protein